jgi:phage gp45-like
MIRGIITSVVEGMIKRFTASGRAGETISNREYMQHYGLTSRPLPGAECVIIKSGNHYIMVASDDRRHRLAVENGEVALYTDEGDKVHLKRGKVIEIIAGEQLIITTKAAQIEAATSTTVTSPQVTVASPEINLGGDRAALQALIDARVLALFNGHKHLDTQPGSGTSGAPDTTLTPANCCTTITKAG